METPARVFTYETLKVGEVFVSPGRTITEADHGLFTMLSGDWHPIHCDEDYARKTPLGRRLVHGTLGITLANSGARRRGSWSRVIRSLPRSASRNGQ